MAASASEDVVRHLWGSLDGDPNSRIHAILDTARSEKIYPGLMKSDVEYECLFPGKQPNGLAETAPYLVRLKAGSVFMNWLIDDGWGDSWGIFLASAADTTQLLRHFRRFLRAQLEDGREFFFRYYDPRVLRVYLPTCNAGEIKTFFGPVSRYVLESENPSVMLRFKPVNEQLETEEITVTP